MDKLKTAQSDKAKPLLFSSKNKTSDVAKEPNKMTINKDEFKSQITLWF